MTKQTQKKQSTILHLGCGNDKKPGAIGVDNNKESAADVIHNLDIFPYPFKTNRFDTIIADNIIEHLENIPRVMEELHRISKNGAKLIISMPYFSSAESFTDPTHKHFFAIRTFDYFIPGTYLYTYKYSRVQFKKIKITLGPTHTTNVFLQFVLFLINKNLYFYEKRLAFIFPIGAITYILEVVKKNATYEKSH